MFSFFKKVDRIKVHAGIVVNLIRLALNPQNTDSALAISDSLLALGYFGPGEDYLRSDKRTSSLVDHSYSIERFDLDQMLQLPKESLGHQLAATMKANNLDPNYFRRSNPAAKGKVVLDHIEQTHDIWHLVLGFDTSEAGEVGLLAFQFGQLRSPQAVAFMGGAFFRCLYKDIRNLVPVMDAIAKGWRLAKAWPPLFAVNWANVMHVSIDAIRQDLDNGVIPAGSMERLVR